MKYTQEEIEKDIQDFKAITDEMAEVRKRKSADYGNSWSLFGLMGIIYQIMSKAIRIWNLRNSEPQNESLKDSFRDIAVYSIMAQMLINRNDTEPKI